MADNTFTDLGEAFSEEALAKAEQEVSLGYRIVKVANLHGNKSTDVKILFPSIEVDSEASKIYSKVMSELLTAEESVVTREEMMNIMEKRGIWGPSQEEEMEQIDERMANLMREGQSMHSKKAVNKSRLKGLKSEYLVLKKRKNELVTKRESFMSNTVEGSAEIASLEYKLFSCCRTKDGGKIWEVYEDFKKDFNRVAIVDLLQKAMVFWSGLPQGVLNMLPEDFVLNLGEQDSEQSPASQSGD